MYASKYDLPSLALDLAQCRSVPDARPSPSAAAVGPVVEHPLLSALAVRVADPVDCPLVACVGSLAEPHVADEDDWSALVHSRHDRGSLDLAVSVKGAIQRSGGGVHGVELVVLRAE